MKLRLSKIRWRFQFSLFTLLSGVTVVAIVLGVVPIVRMELALRALLNKDVEVHGGYLGLQVDLKSRAAEYLKRVGPNANRALERTIADPERFAAAHVLLSEINDNQSNFSGSASHHNNMQITLYGDERGVEFHAEQIPKLQEYWRNRLDAHHPSTK
jgi:hypothetical protein